LRKRSSSAITSCVPFIFPVISFKLLPLDVVKWSGIILASLFDLHERTYVHETCRLNLFPVCGMTSISTTKNDVGFRYCTGTDTSYPFLLINIMKLSSPLAFSKRHVQTSSQFSCYSTIRSRRVNFEKKNRRAQIFSQNFETQSFWIFLCFSFNFSCF